MPVHNRIMAQRFKFYSYADGNPEGCMKCHAEPISVQVTDYDTNAVIELIGDNCAETAYEEHPDSRPFDTMERKKET